jgi:uroporphyrinogen-III decarboxylase
MYEKYVEPMIKDYADILHKSDKILFTHMCGKLKGLSKQIARSAMDGIVDIAPQPTGDVSLGEARRLWGSDKVVMGGIDATAFKGLTPDGIKEYVKDILKDLGTGEGVMLGSADATPQGAPIANMRAITEVVKEHGNFPLALK